MSVQPQNIEAVNNAYNDLLIEEEDYDTLRVSIDAYDNFDALELAARLKDHELLEFRRLAAHLYRKNGRFDDSIALSKSDTLFRDAVETAAHSGEPSVAEDLLSYFVDTGNKECYAAMLFACYDLLLPDVVMEMSWRHALQDFTMPYQIQQARDTRMKLQTLEKEVRERAAKDSAKEKQDEDTPILGPGAFANRLLTASATGPDSMMMPPSAGGMFP